MRIRQVRPEFFTDTVTAHLPVWVRLTYIGLWCVADDAGWLRWDSASIGAVLYPYETPGRRERHLSQALGLLTAVGRLRAYDCGCVLIPTMPAHQRIGGTKATPAKDLHAKDHRKAKIVGGEGDVQTSTDESAFSASNVSNGSYSRARAREDEGETEEERKAAQIESFRRLGLPVDAP